MNCQKHKAWPGHASGHQLDVCAVGPHLSRGLAVPAPAEDILSRLERRGDLHDVADGLVVLAARAALARRREPAAAVGPERARVSRGAALLASLGLETAAHEVWPCHQLSHREQSLPAVPGHGLHGPSTRPCSHGSHACGVELVSLVPAMQRGPRAWLGTGIIAHIEPGGCTPSVT